MTDVDHVLSDFIRAWEDGALPDPDEYLARVPEDRQAELADLMRTYLKVAPEPDYDDATWDALAADPVAVAAAARPIADEPEPWPSLLPRLREKAGLTWRQVAERLEVSRPERAARFLEQMEAGRHDPQSVTVKLLERLGHVLGVSAEALAWRGSPAAPAPALYRAPASKASAPRVMLDMLAERAMSSAGDWDDVDELFLGGRDQPGS